MQLRPPRLRWSRIFGWDEFNSTPEKIILSGFMAVILVSFIELLKLPGFSGEEAKEYIHFPSYFLPDFIANGIFYSKTLVSQIINFCIVINSLLIFAIFSRWRKVAVLIFTLLFLIRFFLYLQNVLSWEVFDHVLFLFGFPLLFFRGKKSGALLCLSLIYVLAAIAKITPSWLSARVFLSIPDGYLPLIPDNPVMLKIACWSLLLCEITSPYFLLNTSERIRKYAILFWMVFHAYTLLFLGYKFPLRMLTLLTAVYMVQRYTKISFRKVHLAYAGVILIWSVIHFAIPGARTVTGEWRSAGLYMFDSNNTCKVELKVEVGNNIYRILHHEGYPRGVRLFDGTIKRTPMRQFRATVTNENGTRRLKGRNAVVFLPESDTPIYNRKMITSRSRRMGCSPYVYLTYLKNLKDRLSPQRIDFRMSVELNGRQSGWFETVHLTENQIDQTHYHHFSHNPWIKTPDNSYPAEYHWP